MAQSSSIGLGMIPITPRDDSVPRDRAFSVLRAALDTGCTSWNAGEFYGTPTYNSLVLINDFFTAHPGDANKISLNVKGAFTDFKPDGSRDAIRASVDNCLALLGGKAKIDMFEMARRDVNVPLADSLRALEELVKEGKIGGVALSEVNAQTIREATKVTKIVAVEVELSLWSREPLENGIAAACAELGIPIHAYSPLGHGMLTGAIHSREEAPEFMRKMFPRFQPGAFENNLKLVREVKACADKLGVTTAQLALGWLKAVSKKPGMPQIIPIPGTSNPDRVKENAKPAEIDSETMKALDAILAEHEIVGTRYPEQFMHLTNM